MRRTTRSRMVPTVAALAAVVGLGLVGCSSPADDAASTTTTAAPATTPTTTVPVTSPITSGTSSTAPVSTPTTAAPPTTSAALTPGQPCTLGSDPDCIDPLAIGEGVYLIGGAQCVADATNAGLDPSTCADLDGDGYAGYPDRG